MGDRVYCKIHFHFHHSITKFCFQRFWKWWWWTSVVCNILNGLWFTNQSVIDIHCHRGICYRTHDCDERCVSTNRRRKSSSHTIKITSGVGTDETLGKPHTMHSAMTSWRQWRRSCNSSGSDVWTNAVGASSIQEPTALRSIWAPKARSLQRD